VELIGSGAVHAWDPNIRMLAQSGLGLYRVVSDFQFGAKRGEFYFDDATYINSNLQGWGQLYSGPSRLTGTINPASRGNINPSFLTDKRLAICSGNGEVRLWRFDLKTRRLDRSPLVGGMWETRALFTAPQSETPLGVESTSLLCDGARNQLWVIESASEGGGIWRYLGNP
jgi:hypothetical protein